MVPYILACLRLPVAETAAAALVAAVVLHDVELLKWFPLDSVEAIGRQWPLVHGCMHAAIVSHSKFAGLAVPPAAASPSHRKMTGALLLHHIAFVLCMWRPQYHLQA